MIDTLLEIKLLNVKQLLDGVLGSFKMNLGLVYNQPDRCYAYKWIVFSNPKDNSGEMKVL